ncbi:outer membrane protein assembly factor BamD [Fulvivirga sedimenti]|uniref:Amino acid ABC transporter substrate-binding protein n=1 Tax=Fulvivirga sedimenti TaxID=2879465 RepID=A0A9X1HU82_9BACT|nr:outer membrane protein assembly factor BamD [Fulvivirga sedimenti]MCA6075352.1 hypothetical protein [Fulvivirga sedimenti]MCA6076529.1 hypothetical protein [Fulvivirga sedimenti]MCA6077657.1 hypothetical protein [Fulvivirga sedimenti]
MKKLYYLIVVVFIFISGVSQAQINYQQQYLNAKNLYKEGQYALAMEAFKPLIKRDPQNPFAAYASYFLGVSTYKAGYEEQAKDVFLQTRERFPNWSKIDEVNYWLAKSYFDNNDDFLAMNVIAGIRDPQIKNDSEGLIYNYLMPDTTPEEMKALYDRYKSPVIGKIYAAKLSSVALDKEGRETLENLVNTYNLDPDKYLATAHASEIKDSYKVAVMMPFLIKSLKPNDKKRVNEFVIDMYKGLKLGFDSLRSIGIDIEVYAYDTQRDTTVTRAILQKDELKGMDLIIGPLFPDPTRMVNEFSQQYGINMYNPLTSAPDYLANNPFYFMYNPSVLTIGEVMADYAFEKYGSKPGIVFYGETSNDRLLAQSYADRYSELGGKLSIIEAINKDRTRKVLEILLSSESIKEAASEEGRENMAIQPDSIGHVFVASSNSLIFSKVISAVETRGDSIKIMGAADWMDQPVVNYEVYERLGAILYAPGYVNRQALNYSDFRKKYLRRHREVPTDYSEKGFEMAMFLGQSLKNYGNFPQVGWNENGRMKGVITPGFEYNNAQDNQLVPVLEVNKDGIRTVIRERQKEESK